MLRTELQETYVIEDVWAYDLNTYNGTNPPSLDSIPTNFKIEYEVYHSLNSNNGVYLIVGGVYCGSYHVYNEKLITLNQTSPSRVTLNNVITQNEWIPLELSYDNGVWVLTRTDTGQTISLEYVPLDRALSYAIESNASIKNIKVKAL